MTYAWIIDRDVLFDEAGEEDMKTGAGMMGPSTILPGDKAALKAGEGTRFRMYDDGDELYYEGRLIGDWRGDDGFAPLDDFGAPNAGCTKIEYFNGESWDML